MQVAIEISMYPLLESYEPSILDFITRLNQHPNLRIRTNEMSTQIFGEYDLIMNILTKEMKESFEQGKTTIMIMKVLVVNT